MSQQGIYVSPDCITPNRDRDVFNDLKLWIIEFELFVSGSIVTKGCAVVKANNPNSAVQLLTKEGMYNATSNKYSIIRVAEIIPSPSSMLICEQINDINYGN